MLLTRLPALSEAQARLPFRGHQEPSPRPPTAPPGWAPPLLMALEMSHRPSPVEWLVLDRPLSLLSLLLVVLESPGRPRLAPPVYLVRPQLAPPVYRGHPQLAPPAYQVRPQLAVLVCQEHLALAQRQPAELAMPATAPRAPPVMPLPARTLARQRPRAPWLESSPSVSPPLFSRSNDEGELGDGRV